MHIAAHAEADPVTGAARILLAGDTSLDTSDVLVQGGTPARVVLMACNSAQADIGAVSLAQAWLARGARLVVSSTTALDDTDAASFADSLYAAGFAQDKPEAAFRAAVLTDPTRHKVFRLLGP